MSAAVASRAVRAPTVGKSASAATAGMRIRGDRRPGCRCGQIRSAGQRTAAVSGGGWTGSRALPVRTRSGRHAAASPAALKRGFAEAGFGGGGCGWGRDPAPGAESNRGLASLPLQAFEALVEMPESNRRPTIKSRVLSLAELISRWGVAARHARYTPCDGQLRCAGRDSEPGPLNVRSLVNSV